MESENHQEKKIRTIRWDGTCKKCGVKSYFAPVNVKTDHGYSHSQMMCILCYWRAKKNEREKIPPISSS